MIKLLNLINENSRYDSWQELFGEFYQSKDSIENKSIDEQPLNFINWLIKNYNPPQKPIKEEIPSRVKYNIGEKIIINRGKYKDKEGIIKDTYLRKHGGNEGKDQFEIYIPSIKQTVSWFRPIDLKKK